MSQTQDLLEGKVRQLRTTRSRLHYKPISVAEFVLTTGLSVFVGVGMFILTTIDVPQNHLDRLGQLKAVE